MKDVSDIDSKACASSQGGLTQPTKMGRKLWSPKKAPKSAVLESVDSKTKDRPGNGNRHCAQLRGTGDDNRENR